ncbi:Importin-11, partial [Ilyodon furcidens]
FFCISAGPTNAEDPVQLLMKDAVYNAVGLAAYELFDNVDFDQWFKNQLLGELQVSHHRTDNHTHLHPYTHT